MKTKKVSSLLFSRDEWAGDVVYFVGNESVNRVKIGKSKGAVFINRFHDLKTGFPGILHVLGIMHGGFEKEKELHKRFRRDCVGLEWFVLSDDIKEFVKDNTYQVTFEKPVRKSEKPKSAYPIQTIEESLNKKEGAIHRIEKCSIRATKLLKDFSGQLSAAIDASSDLVKANVPNMAKRGQ